MINIQISEALEGSSHSLPDLPLSNLERAARRAVRGADLDQEAEVTVLLTDDAQVQALNRQYRAIDAPTDVLSFPTGETDPDSGLFYLGDIVISLPQAQVQAQTEQRSLEAELSLLVVHGVLHLLGYDHADEGEKAVMWAVQTEILADLATERK